MRESNRLRGSYGMAVGIALLGLSPNSVLSSAFLPLRDVIAEDLGAGSSALGLAEGMSNAGYAFGAVLAAALAQRLPQRRLFLVYEAGFVLGSVLAAAAPGLAVFFVGRLLQGTMTGFMLVSALPPLVTRFGVGRLPVTVAVVNIGLFGATTVGPVLGGVTASSGSWRTLLMVTAVLAAVGWVTAALGYVRIDPLDPDAPADRPAVLLAVLASVLTFAGTSMLSGSSATSPLFLGTVVPGLVALLVLVVVEYRKERPLMPVEALSTQLPVTGTVVAMVAGAVFVAAIELVQIYLTQVAGEGPAAAGWLFWPMPVGVLVSSVVFGALFRTRFVPVLVNVGLVALCAGTALMLVVQAPETGPAVLVAAALLGFGAGATVSPGLFMASLGVPSRLMGRAFALVELLRLVAGYAVGPVVLHVAMQAPELAGGIRTGLWVVLGLGVLGFVASLVIPATSGARMRRPDLETWLAQGDQALASPRTGIHVRPGVEDESAAPLVPGRLRRRR